MNNASPEYLAALETSNIAIRAYDVAVKAYRAGKMDDKTYLAARKVYNESVKAFDLAFALEDEREENRT